MTPKNIYDDGYGGLTFENPQEGYPTPGLDPTEAAAIQQRKAEIKKFLPSIITLGKELTIAHRASRKSFISEDEMSEPNFVHIGSQFYTGWCWVVSDDRTAPLWQTGKIPDKVGSIVKKFGMHLGEPYFYIPDTDQVANVSQRWQSSTMSPLQMTDFGLLNTAPRLDAHPLFPTLTKEWLTPELFIQDGQSLINMYKGSPSNLLDFAVYNKATTSIIESIQNMGM